MFFSYLEMCEEIMPKCPGAAYTRVRLINGISQSKINSSTNVLY